MRALALEMSIPFAFTWSTFQATQADEIEQEFANDPDVERVTVDTKRSVEATSDPEYSNQWALDKIGWPDARSLAPATGSATIAVVDTGVSADST